MDRKAHWEQVYTTKDPTSVSWYQREAARSHALIRRYAPDLTAAVIDVGSGATVLTRQLLDEGYAALTVLDISGAALATARTQLGADATRVTWLEADALHADLPTHHYACWHDRAVFHFLTNADDQATYGRQLRRALAPGGHAIIATFAEDGPLRCSGLDIVRYTPDALVAALGPGVTLVEAEREMHTTPGGGGQAFQYSVLRVG